MFPDVDGFEYWSNKAKELECIDAELLFLIYLNGMLQMKNVIIK